MARPGRGSPVAVLSGGGTGGHLYPALALAEGITAVRPDLRIFFLGAQRGLEARILPERGFDHLLLPVQGFRRGQVLRNLAVLWALLRSVVLTGQLFARLKPVIVVATGGYASGPAGMVAAIMGIPLALQEQNAQPGFTSRVLSRWSRQVHIAFPEARNLLPERARPRAILSGNPVRPIVKRDEVEARARFGMEVGTQVLLVTGGSQGAKGINEAMLDLVRGVEEGDLEGSDDLRVLWATGSQNLEGVQGELAALGSPGWVNALGYIHDMPDALSFATMAVGRAGAMTTSEFLAWGIPAVLIPLPTSAADHQMRNAESLEAAGAAVHLPETELTGSALWGVIRGLQTTPGTLDAMRGAAHRLGRPEATRRIAEAMMTLVPSPSGAVRGGEGEA